MNRRLALCQRQSHRVMPIRESIHEKTLFRSLYTHDVLEETFENSSSDETDTSNQNSSINIFNTINIFLWHTNI